MRALLRAALLLAPCGALVGCGGGTLDTRGAEQAASYKAQVAPADAIQVPDGYRAVQVVEGLNFPSSMAWDDKGSLYILESHSVAVPTLKPKILKVAGNGELEEVRWEGPGAPTGETAVGLAFRGGWLYLSHEEKDGTWGISRLRPSGGAAEPVIRGMPGDGDHWVNYLAFDGQGSLYFGVGSATNSGVVSSQDPVNQKWLKKRPKTRDIPCRDVVLTGKTFTDDNALTDPDDDKATTGAYQAYGESAATQVAGKVPCTGAIFRLRAGATTPELVGWGFRNPVALAFDPRGTLLVGMHGADIRGTRPVLDDPDAIYRVRPGVWYGWPDYSGALEPVTAPKHRAPAQFLAPGHSGLEFVFDHAASGLAAPDKSLLVTVTEPHAALGGMSVVPAGGPFSRWSGQLLISEMGDFKPTTDAVRPDVRTGFQVEAVDLQTGRRTVFARNRGAGAPQPASRLDLEVGLERPVDVQIGPDGLVYILDFGVFNPTEKTMKVFPKTGRVFRVEPAGR
ncbi:MAG: sorbosone dehydrogenase family protein [Thermoanaerobaculia bacterium]